MRIINISHADYANFSYENSMAMRSVGLNSEAFILTKHPFGYTKQATKCNVERIKHECEKADIVQVMHTCGTMWDIVKEMDKPVIVWHTGTRYRQDPGKHNTRWNGVANKHICALGEFMKLGCENPDFFSITINTDYFKPDFSVGKNLRIAHYPSNPEVKGTDAINRVMRNTYGCIYHSSHIKLNHTASIKRMSGNDVYIEMCSPLQEGKEYGSFGTTACEAAALGMIVITNNVSGVYEKYYQDCKLIFANNEKQLSKELKRLLSLKKEQIIELKKSSRQWVEKNHGYHASGTRMIALLKKLNIPELEFS